MSSPRKQSSSPVALRLSSAAWITPSSYLEEMSLIYWTCTLTAKGRLPPDSTSDVTLARSLAKSFAKRFPEDFARFRLTDAAIHTLASKETITQTFADEAGLVYMVPASRLLCLENAYGFFSYSGQLMATLHGFVEGLDWLQAYRQALELANECRQSERASRSHAARL